MFLAKEIAEKIEKISYNHSREEGGREGDKEEQEGEMGEIDTGRGGRLVAHFPPRAHRPAILSEETNLAPPIEIITSFKYNQLAEIQRKPLESHEEGILSSG